LRRYVFFGTFFAEKQWQKIWSAVAATAEKNIPAQFAAKIPKHMILFKKIHWKRYFFLILLILLASGIVFAYRLTQKPAQGVILPSKQEDPLKKIAQEVPGSFLGKYVSFMYPNGYVEKSHEVADSDSAVILETVYVSQTSATSKKIALTVRSLPSGNLEDDPDYQMRELNPKKYKKESFAAGQVSGQSFVPADDGQFEKTFFIKHEGLLAIIAVTAPAMPDQTRNDEADGIAKSLEWVK